MVVYIKVIKGQDILEGRGVMQKMRTRTVPATSNGMYRWGMTLERDLIASSMNAGIKRFKGNLQGGGIRWEQKNNARVGRLMMPAYGIMLDSMKPHHVTVKKTRTNLLAWARRASNPKIRKKARQIDAGTRKRFGIFVRPHPFIDRGFKTARPKLNAIVRRELRKEIKTWR